MNLIEVGNSVINLDNVVEIYTSSNPANEEELVVTVYTNAPDTEFKGEVIPYKIVLEGEEAITFKSAITGIMREFTISRQQCKNLEEM